MRLFPLPKECLLTKSWQYRYVYKFGHRIRTNGVTFIYCSNSVERDRLGISVSGVKSAVRRNRTKRLIREFYRLNPLFPSIIAKTTAGSGSHKEKTQPGFDLVIATNRYFAPANFRHIETVFLSLLTER